MKLKTSTKSSKRISIFQYIIEQNTTFLNRLYGNYNSNELVKQILYIKQESKSLDISSPQNHEALFTCKAIFQSLSSITKVYLMKMIFLDIIEKEDIIEWSRDNIQFHKAFKDLRNYRIIIFQNDEDYDEIDDGNYVNLSALYTINKYFKANFLKSLSCPMEPWSESNTNESKSSINEHISIDKIESYSIERWNNILKYLIKMPIQISLTASIIEFLKNDLRLITNSQDLTSFGYEFMLKDYPSQIWDFVWKIIEIFPNQEDSIQFLFMLSYCELGKSYPLNRLSSTQRKLSLALKEIGILVYNRTDNPSHFYPTRAAINLIFRHEESNTQNEDISTNTQLISSSIRYGLKIIVETNMQVVAYVSNELHIALLRLFIDIHIKMSNMVIGKINREKTKEAFKVGITVAQMIDFLSSHSHEVTRTNQQTNNLSVPDNVLDQLVLWQKEGERIQEEEAIVITFDSYQTEKTVFIQYVEFLKRINGCLWFDDKKFLIAATVDGFNALQSVQEKK